MLICPGTKTHVSDLTFKGLIGVVSGLDDHGWIICFTLKSTLFEKRLKKLINKNKTNAVLELATNGISVESFTVWAKQELREHQT